MSLYAYRLWNNVAEEKRETVNSREIKCFVILLGIIEMFFLFFYSPWNSTCHFVAPCFFFKQVHIAS